MTLKKLTKHSKKIAQPDNIKIPLRDHQLSMLYRCLEIEKNNSKTEYPYGAITDKAGSGKTAVVISLILADKTINGKTQNLIVVPQNIYKQWLEEFNKFCENGVLQIKSFTEYSDITDLYLFNKKNFEKYDVLITTDLYYNVIYNVLNQEKINIKRTIFDEIDNFQNQMKMISFKKNNLKMLKIDTVNTEKDNTYLQYNYCEDNESKSYFTWFISASFNNCLNAEDGLVFGDIQIPIDKLKNLICKCDDDYIEESEIKIDKAIEKVVEFSDITDVFFNCLSLEQLEYLNSFSYKRILNNKTKKTANNAKEALRYIVENIYNDYLNNL